MGVSLRNSPRTSEYDKFFELETHKVNVFGRLGIAQNPLEVQKGGVSPTWLAENIANDVRFARATRAQ